MNSMIRTSMRISPSKRKRESEANEKSTAEKRQRQEKVVNKSIFKGVFWNKDRAKWEVNIFDKSGQTRGTSHFSKEVDAAQFLNSLCDKYGKPRKNPSIGTFKPRPKRANTFENPAPPKYDRGVISVDFPPGCTLACVNVLKRPSKEWLALDVGRSMLVDRATVKQVFTLSKPSCAVNLEPGVYHMVVNYTNESKKWSKYSSEDIVTVSTDRKSMYNGVSWSKVEQKWMAVLRHKEETFVSLLSSELLAAHAINLQCDILRITRLNFGIGDPPAEVEPLIEISPKKSGNRMAAYSNKPKPKLIISTSFSKQVQTKAHLQQKGKEYNQKGRIKEEGSPSKKQSKLKCPKGHILVHSPCIPNAPEYKDGLCCDVCEIGYADNLSVICMGGIWICPAECTYDVCRVCRDRLIEAKMNLSNHMLAAIRGLPFLERNKLAKLRGSISAKKPLTKAILKGKWQFRAHSGIISGNFKDTKLLAEDKEADYWIENDTVVSIIDKEIFWATWDGKYLCWSDKEKWERFDESAMSKYHGVTWSKLSKKWLCRVKKPDGTFECVGYFNTEKEAANNYDNRVRQVHKKNLSNIELNFPNLKKQGRRFYGKVRLRKTVKPVSYAEPKQFDLHVLDQLARVALPVQLTPQTQKRSRMRDDIREEKGREIPDGIDDPPCCICGSRGRPEAFLLCENENCTSGLVGHFDCLGLSKIPENDWFCPIHQPDSNLKQELCKSESDNSSSDDEVIVINPKKLITGDNVGERKDDEEESSSESDVIIFQGANKQKQITTQITYPWLKGSPFPYPPKAYEQILEVFSDSSDEST